jgi:hypothetical protein
MRTLQLSLLLVIGAGASAGAQSVLFDFEDAHYRSPLPIDLTSGSVTAHFSATGQGFSVQRADTMGFTPVGILGLCIYPSSVYPADLAVSFNRTLTDFSVLYAPQELACDSSARMRVTGYLNGAFVGTSTMTAEAGTWPTATLALSAATGFNSVVVHYDAPPPTGGDYGPIFMVDNVNVTVLAVPGDYDQNGLVDGADLLLWQQDLNMAAVPAGSGCDGNKNGLVEAGDLATWQGHFGVGGIAAGSAGVPEPSTLILATAWLLCCLDER